MLDVNYLFPFRKEQNSCPHFTGEKLTLQEDKSLLRDIELIMVCRSLSEPMLLTAAAAALIVPNDTTLE